jgi:hypothetical protein
LGGFVAGLMTRWLSQKCHGRECRTMGRLGLLGRLRFSFLAGFFASFLLLGSVSCAPREQTSPLYPSVPLVIEKRLSVKIETDVPMTIVQPTVVQRVIDKVFGWIPVVGELLKLPVNLALTLMPALESVSQADLPGDSEINNPDVLRRVTYLGVSDGHIFIVPESQRGKDYEPERCWFRKCSDIGLNFIKELRVYIIFERSNSGRDESVDESVALLIGTATFKNDYDPKRQSLNFRMTGKNLQPYFESYPKRRVELIAEGRLPKRAAYVAGSFSIQADVMTSEQ